MSVRNFELTILFALLLFVIDILIILNIMPTQTWKSTFLANYCAKVLKEPFWKK